MAIDTFTRGSFNGALFDELMKQKYRNQTVETNAQAAANYAAARKNAMDAALAPGLSSAEIAQRRSTAKLQNEQAGVVRPIADARIAGDMAQARRANVETDWYGPRSAADITQSLSSAGYNDAMAYNARMKVPDPFSDPLSESPFATRNILDDEQFATRLGAKKGMTRVPGRGSGDKVPMMLEPGEAVLNKKAAGMMGRDKIAKLNAKGNQQRQKSVEGRVAKLLKQMGMV